MNSVKDGKKDILLDALTVMQIRAGDGSQTRALRRIDTNTLLLPTTIQHDMRDAKLAAVLLLALTGVVASADAGDGSTCYSAPDTVKPGCTCDESCGTCGYYEASGNFITALDCITCADSSVQVTAVKSDGTGTCDPDYDGSATLSEADCSTWRDYMTCSPPLSEPHTEATCNTTVCAWSDGQCNLSDNLTWAFIGMGVASPTYRASTTAGEEACAADADCEILTTNTLTIELSDGTSQSGKPNVCSGSAGACEFGSESLWYYVDQCLAKGYPMGPIQVQASAGNSVVPAFALAFVSAAVAAFA